MEKYRMEELLECVLTNQEIMDKAGILSRRNQEKSRLDGEKKVMVSNFAAKINSCEADIEQLSLAITTRRESRKVECEIKYNEPKDCQKTIVRTDTGAIVRIEMMTQSEIDDLFINTEEEENDNNGNIVIDAEVVEDNTQKQLTGPAAKTEEPETYSESTVAEGKIDIEEENVEPVINGEEPNQVPSDIIKNQMIFDSGRILEVVIFEDVQVEAMEALKKNEIIYASDNGNKKVPFSLEDIVKVNLPEVECKVILYVKNGKNWYYIWTFPGRPYAIPEKEFTDPVGECDGRITIGKGAAEILNPLCGHPHADGIRTCERYAGHDGKHYYGKAVKKDTKPVIKEVPESEPVGDGETMSLPELLATEGVTIDDAETYLRKIGKLGFTISLMDNPKLITFVTDNFVTFCKEVKGQF